MRRLQPTLWIITLLALSTLCRADVAPDILQRGKKATALVEIEGGKGYGTAFCVDASGFFVTNEHVVSALGGSKTLTLILNSGEKDQKKLTARLIRQDKNADLALLKVDATPGLTTLELGNSDRLSETQAVMAFGYPFGKDLAGSAEEYPAITISTGHITALRKSRGVLQEIQLDASLNPGNSGGPVLDGNGQVIGIVMSGIEGSGVNFAVPVQHLHSLLNRIDLILSPTSLAQEKVHEMQVFTIETVALGKNGVGLSVEMVLEDGKEPPRTFVAKSVDGHTFTVSAVPVPIPNRADLLHIITHDENGEQRFSIPDRTIQVDGKAYRLSQVRHIQRDTSTTVTLTNGQTLYGSVTGLESIPTQITGSPASLNLSKVHEIAIERDDDSIPFLEYHLIAIQHGKVVGEESGSLLIERAPFPFKTAERAATVPTAIIAHIPWVRVSGGSGPLSIPMARGCDILLPANSSEPQLFFIGYQTRAQLRGDFDIQISYQLLEWPELNGVRFGIEVLNSPGAKTEVLNSGIARLATIHRVSFNATDHLGEIRKSETVTVSNVPGYGSEQYARVAADSLKGKMRLTRTGGRFTGYRWNEMTGKWQEILSGGNHTGNVKINLIAWSNDGEFGHKQVRILLYDFIVNQGEWVLP